ncbi:TetR/AcrR family transcriptional regulator [Candidatus Blastococcus massiliensis]|uniref:TetR/AcrR family transcriptional regulator n=1 Tax=Candidatus Blastococcus massiliensis TaxID=1470358 RepID=UPI0004B062FD|nr:TetR/AcrR family transcriptional regulator [Candidatus Blastococcus massiliensis]
MPKLWTETIDAHRRSVREAILDTAWALVAERGLLAVTMSQIAETTGIGRATLYKYFPDVEAILVACHERHVADHLGRLSEIRDQHGGAEERLEAVLQAYALILHHRGRHGTEEMAALVHRGEHIDRAQHEIVNLITEILVEVASTNRLREDVGVGELATFCVHALAAAGRLPSEAAVRRLVSVTLAGLRPPS